MKLTEHEMLVTLATAALNMDDFTGHDVLESLKELGYAGVIAEARNSGHHQLGDDGCCSLCGIAEEEIEKTPVCTEKARAAHGEFRSIPPHPMQPIVVDKTGVHRFKENAIVRHMLEEGTMSGFFSLNSFAAKRFPREDHEQLAQLIGYSVSGACDLSYMSDEVCDAALAESKMIKQRIVKPVEVFTLRVDGKPFRCEGCGSNCFHRYTEDPLKYECNGCGARHTGEK